MGILQKITDSLDNYPALQCAWFLFGVCVMVPIAFVYDTAMVCRDIAKIVAEVCRDIAKIVAEVWREMRKAQRARQRDDDDDDDLPNYFAAAS